MIRPIHIALCLLCTAVAHAADPEWSERDAEIANQYVRILGEKPETGQVLDLLWKHYERHAATADLIGHYQEEDGSSARVIYGLLLWKNGDLDMAAQQLGGDSPFAVRARAQLAAARKDFPTAETAFKKLGDGALIDLARVQMQMGKRDDAARNLERAFGLADDVAETQTIARLTLQTGSLAAAIAQFDALKTEGDEAQQAATLRELARLHELAGDFTAAEQALKTGMAMSHFRHAIHREFFTRLVRLKERNGDIEDFEQSLLAERKTEETLYRRALLYELTVEFEKKEAVLIKLSKIQGYRRDLALHQFQHGDDAAAAKTLDAILAAEQPLDLVLMRASIELRASGKDAVAKRLEDWISANPDDEKALASIRRFAEENYIDRIAERLILQNPTEESPLELAQFYLKRNLDAKAQEVLQRYATDREKKLSASRILVANKQFEGALAIVRSLPSGREVHLELATILDAMNDREGAITEMEKAIQLSQTPTGWQEIDTLLINTLNAAGLEAGQDLTSPLDFISSVSEPDENPFPNFRAGAVNTIPRFTDRVHDYQKKLSRRPDTTKELWRSAWWSHRTSNFQKANEALSSLLASGDFQIDAHLLASRVAHDIQDTDQLVRHLKRLREIDPKNIAGHSLDLAKTLHESKRTIDPEILRALDPENPTALSLLREVDPDAAAIAFANFDPANRARLLEAYTQGLIADGGLVKALEQHMEVFDNERDTTRRRQVFSRQLKLATTHDQLPWMRNRYQQLSMQNPLDGSLSEALAEIFRAEGNNQLALESMRNAYYNSPTPSAAKLLPALRDLSAETGNLTEAIYYQRQLLNNPGVDVAEWHRLVVLLERDLRMGEADRARVLLDRKLVAEPATATTRIEEYLSKQQFQHALRFLESAVRLRPWEARNQFLLGLARKRSGDLAGAIESFENALKNNPPGDQPHKMVPPFTDARTGEDLLDRLPSAESLQWSEISFIEIILRESIDAFEEYPNTPSGLRLRSIEELARLKASDSAWCQRWEEPETDSTETLWAQFYSGNLKEVPQTESRWELVMLNLLNSVMALRIGQFPDVETRYIDAALQLLTLEENFDFGSIDFRNLIELERLSLKQCWILAETLAQAGRYHEAIGIGTAVEPLTIARAPRASLRKWERLAGTVGKSESGITAKVDATSSLDPGLQRRILSGKGGGDSFEPYLDRIAYRDPFPEFRVARPRSTESPWDEILYVTRAARAFGKGEDADTALDKLLKERPLLGSMETSSRASFFLERMFWDFPDLTLPERIHRAQQLAAETSFYDEILRIADALDRRGFDREALEIYQEMMRRFPDDAAFDHGRLLGTCAEIEDYKTALAHLDRLRADPPDLGLDYIYTQHAKFLAMAGDTGALRSFGKLSGATYAAQKPYLDALVRYHKKRGEWQAALETASLRTPDTEGDIDLLLERGECRLRLDHHAAAASTLEQIPLVRADHVVESATIQMLAEAYLKLHRKGELRQLFARATDYDDAILVLKLAEIASATRPVETVGMLKLAAGKFEGADDRFAINLEVLAREPNIATLDAALSIWADQPNSLRRLAEIARQVNAPDWAEALQGNIDRPSRKSLPSALVFFALGQSESINLTVAITAFANAPGLSQSSFGVGVETLIASQRPEAAQLLLDLVPNARPQITVRTGQRLEVAHHLGDTATVQSIYIDAMRHAETPGTHNQLETRLPEKFAALGLISKSRDLFDAQHARMHGVVSTKMFRFYHGYFYFLLATGDFRAAEGVLMREFEHSVAAKPKRIADLYRAWGKLDSLDKQLPKFHLTPGQELRLRELAEQQ